MLTFNFQTKQFKLLAIALLAVSIAIVVVADTATTGASITNSVPVASSVQIAPGNLDAGEVSLTSNTTEQLNFTATITDNNGCTEISEVNATWFRTNLTGGSGAADDNRSHYSMVCTVQSGTCAGVGDIAATYDCKMNSTWFADATDVGSFYADTNWTINVTPYDSSGEGTSGTNAYDMKTVTSFSLQSASIDFGGLGLGANTSTTNQNISVVNLGNEAIDISLTGYGAFAGDNRSMNCTLGNITIDHLQYSNESFTYGLGTNLSNASTELDFDLDRGSDTTNRPEKLSFYGFSIPTEGVGGSCSGNIVIVATSDPGLD